MYIRIEGDPTCWQLRPAIDPEQLTASTAPTELAVSDPLAGTLLLSRRLFGSVVILSPPPDSGHIPNGLILTEPCLYVPSTTGPDPHSNPPRYYQLDRSEDLQALRAKITAAMSGGTFITVNVTGRADTGVVVLNGAALSFVVVCPATPMP